MIAKLDCGLGGHFKGRFVAKNSNTTLEWRKRVWMYGFCFQVAIFLFFYVFFSQVRIQTDNKLSTITNTLRKYDMYDGNQNKVSMSYNYY